MSMGKKVILIVILSLIYLTISLHLPFYKLHSSESSEELPDHPGKWTYSFRPDRGDPKEYGLNSSEIAVFRKKMDQFEKVFHDHPVFKPPKGFVAIASSFAYIPSEEEGYSRTERVAGVFEILLQRFLKVEGGKIIIDTHSTISLKLYTNRPHATLSDCRISYEGLKDLRGNMIYFKPQEIRKIGEYPLYSNNVLVITNSSKPYWIPISREQYLRALIKDAESKRDANHAYDQVVKFFKAELAGLTASKLKEDAYIGPSEKLSHMVDKNEEGAAQLVIFNPDFFDHSLPRTAVQLITVYWDWGFPYDHSTPITLKENGAKTFRLYELLNTLNTNGIAALIDRK